MSFTRRHEVSADRMVDSIKAIKPIAARLAHFDAAYLRFVGDMELSHYRGEELVETHKNDAIW